MKIDLYKISPEGVAFSNGGNATIGFKITFPRVMSLCSEDFFRTESSKFGLDLINTLKLAIEQLEENFVFHQQDLYLPYEALIKNTDDYLVNASEKMWKSNVKEKYCVSSYIFISYRFASVSTAISSINKFKNVVANFSSVLLQNKNKIVIEQLNRESYLTYIQNVLRLDQREEVPFKEIDLQKGQFGEKKIYALAVDGDKCINDVYGSKRQNGNTNSSLSYSWLHETTWSVNCPTISNNYIKIKSKDWVLKNIKDFKKRLTLFSTMFNSEIESSDIYISQAENKRCCLHYFNTLYFLGENSKNIIEQINGAYKTAGLKPIHLLNSGLTDCFKSLFGGTSNHLSFPKNYYPAFLDEAVCFSNYESDYYQFKDGVLLADVLDRPVYVDFDNKPYQENIITNENMLIVGATGTGKSVVTNKMISSLLPTNDYLFIIIDIGGSYKVLSKIHEERSTYIELDTKVDEISFNPFLLPLLPVTEKLVSDEIDLLSTLLQIAWDPKNELNHNINTTTIINDILISFYQKRWSEKKEYVNFNHLYEYVLYLYKTKSDILGKVEYFDVESFLKVTKKYYREGKNEKLFNAKTNTLDIKGKDLIVFELDAIKEDEHLMQLVIALIMMISKRVLNTQTGHKHIKIWLDEAWKFLESGVMAEFLKYLYKTIRKKGGGVGIIVQQIGDITSSPFARTLIENSGTKYFLSHIAAAAALSENANKMGLSPKDVELITHYPFDKYVLCVKQAQQDVVVYKNVISREELAAFSTKREDRDKLLGLIDYYQNTQLAITKFLEDEK